MKRTIYLVALFLGVLLLFPFTITDVVHAANTQLHELHFEVELQEDGSGQIIERSVMTIEEGTENFMPHQDLSRDQITDFEVYANGELLEWQENWNSDRSREEKANEYGILDTVDGIEFVWGIPEYGEVTYELHYTIDEMVWQLEDGQSMHWAFFRGDNLAPEEMSVQLSAPGNLTAENTTLALLGLADAEWELENGHFYAEKTSPLSSNEDIILLLQFEEDWFVQLPYSNQTLEDQVNEALDGSSFQNVESNRGRSIAPAPSAPPSTRMPIFLRFMTGMMSFFPIIWLSAAAFIGYNTLKPFFKRRVRMEQGHMSGVDERIEKNRALHTDETPYEGQLSDIAFFLNEIQAGKFEDYFFAFLLKWAKEGIIDISEQEVGMIRKREEKVIQINGQIQRDATEIERDFWNMLEEAANKEGLIREGELSKWGRKNHRQLYRLQSDLIEDSKKFLVAEGYVTSHTEKHYLFFNVTVMDLTDRGKELFDRILQFENFLIDIEEKKASKEEVEQIGDWEQFMIWSCLLGYSEKVVQELENHFPEVWEDTIYHYPHYSWHRSMYRHRTSLRQGYNKGRSNSSSGGGFSSGSSGGSFSGGGGGSRGGGGRGVR